MPDYSFRHNKTGEVKTIKMKIAELDEFKKSNPAWTQTVECPTISSGRANARPDRPFRELLGSIKKANRGSKINTFD